jgi:hypothetical protein
VSRGHEMFIAPGEYVFEAGGGLDVLALGSDGRIRTDYQFIGV